MDSGYESKKSRSPGLWVVLGLVLLPWLFGCQAKEPPLSPAAAAFKKEVKDCLDRLTPGLAEPLAQADVGAINTTLSKVEPEAIKLCRMCPFRLGVLNKNGETVTVYPFKQDSMADFSSYNMVKETLKSGKIAQQRFFLQDGSELYIICAPIHRQGAVIGILALGLDEAEARKRWGVTEPEFLSLDFNR